MKRVRLTYETAEVIPVCVVIPVFLSIGKLPNGMRDRGIYALYVLRNEAWWIESAFRIVEHA